jgi:hypothetical protein
MDLRPCIRDLMSTMAFAEPGLWFGEGPFSDALSQRAG